MAMTPLDKMKIIGILKKKPINNFDDLYFDTRSKLRIDDYLETIIDATIKFINESSKEDLIEKSLYATELVIRRCFECQITISGNASIKIKELLNTKESLNDNSKKILKNISALTVGSFIQFSKNNHDEILEEEPVEEVVVEEINYREVNSELLKKVNDYETRIKELEHLVTKREHSNTKQAKQVTEQISTISKLKKDLERLNKLLNKKESECDKLISESSTKDKVIDNLSRRVDMLETSNEQASIAVEAYKTYQTNLNEVKNFEYITNLIIELISSKKSTIKEIEKYLHKNGIDVNRETIIKALNILKTRYNIDDSETYNFDRTYYISSITKSLGETFDFKTTRKVLDIMVISDSHIGLINTNDIETMDKIYNYMAKNSIGYIIDLGDLLSYNYLAGSPRSSRIAYNDEIIESLINKYPYSKKVKHLILGGNHDKNILSYGIDPLKKLEDARDDFTSLGYDFATLKLNKNTIGLYHPNFRLKDEYNDNLSINQLDTYCSKTCDANNVNYDNIYVNLFGHFHAARIYDAGLVMCPSIARDRYRNGAYHLKVHFDNHGNIEKMEFVDLIIANKVLDRETTEYTKILKK
jgi:predicted phosphodiesterase/uncharacterized coiled-coil protein SlyX